MEGLFHVHSTYSSDGKLSLEELREECLNRNLKFMVVTDHAEDFTPGKIKKYVNHCREISDEDFWAIPGLEYVIDKEHQVHLLVVNLEGLPFEKGPEAILYAVREGKGSPLAVVAHLSRCDYFIPPDYEQTIDGIEVWNAAYNSRYLPDHKAIDLFIKLKKKNPRLVGFGGLDLHDRTGFRGLRICLKDACRNPNDLLDQLKGGKFIIYGSYFRISSIPRLGSFPLFLLMLGRKIVSRADSCRWRLVSWRRALFSSIFNSDL
ncbi:MAG: PHP domain-containing protein [Deltaproteobacteria bacterium]|nr:PHP domain-containing protein [Deltaproteobacteria bacterium]